MAAAVIVVIVLDVLLPSAVRLGPRWGLVLAGVLLGALIVADPGRIDERTRVQRVLSLALLAVLIVSALASTCLLIHELVKGGELTHSPEKLLVVGNTVWVVNNIVFALFYWECDGGGSAARAHHVSGHPDLAFPQHMNPELAPPGWRPLFFDYFHLGFTNALTFGPCDVMPFVNWAKAAMLIQSIISLAILGLVIASATNVLG